MSQMGVSKNQGPCSTDRKITGLLCKDTQEMEPQFMARAKHHFLVFCYVSSEVILWLYQVPQIEAGRMGAAGNGRSQAHIKRPLQTLPSFRAEGDMSPLAVVSWIRECCWAPSISFPIHSTNWIPRVTSPTPLISDLASGRCHFSERTALSTTRTAMTAPQHSRSYGLTDPRDLICFLQEADVRLVRLEYLIELRESGRAFPRRQEGETERTASGAPALLDAKELKELSINGMSMTGHVSTVIRHPTSRPVTVHFVSVSLGEQATPGSLEARARGGT